MLVALATFFTAKLAGGIGAAAFTRQTRALTCTPTAPFTGLVAHGGQRRAVDERARRLRGAAFFCFETTATRERGLSKAFNVFCLDATVGIDRRVSCSSS